MLLKLKIKNYVLVKDITLDFTTGLQVLSGETGAGKSILVGALNLVLGSQMKGDIFFDKTKPVVLEATFDIDTKNDILSGLLETHQPDVSEGELYISREITPEGKSHSFLNGRRVTATIIREFRDCLFDFHSQRDQQLLLNDDFQLLVLDRFGDLIDLQGQFKEKYHQYHHLKTQIKKEKDKEEKNRERINLYEYQINELEELEFNPSEEEDLDKEYLILTHAQEILENIDQLQQDFYDRDNAVLDRISSSIRNMESFENDSSLIHEISDNLRSVSAHLEEIRLLCRQIPQKIYLDEKRLKEVDERLKVLHRIKNKYRMNLEQLTEFLYKMKQEIRNYLNKDQEIQKLEQVLIKLEVDLIQKAEELTLNRKQAARKLSALIADNLKDLSIPDALFEIKIDKKYDNCNSNENMIKGFDESGQDRIDFLFCANKGSNLQPVKVSASGGELSRILLVIKKILSVKYPPQTIIFDEIDSGIGGKTADMLGSYISRIAVHHQVICITHLAQIAGYAHSHFMISKKSSPESTEITVLPLNRQEKIREIARMLSGLETETALQHAEELLNKTGV